MMREANLQNSQHSPQEILQNQLKGSRRIHKLLTVILKSSLEEEQIREHFLSLFYLLTVQHWVLLILYAISSCCCGIALLGKHPQGHIFAKRHGR